MRDDVNWAILTEIDRAESEIPIRALERQVLLVLLISGLGVILLAILFSSRISKPLRQLADSAGKIARGEILLEHPISGNDEIGLLGRAFRNMTLSLHQKTEYARAIAREQLETPRPCFPPQDVLGNSMVGMHERLIDFIKNLEDLVSARTSALEEKTVSLAREMKKREQLHQVVAKKRSRLRVMTEELMQAEEKERRRIAVGLHDGLSQELAYVQLKLGMLLRDAALPDMIRSSLEDLHSGVKNCLVNARTLTFEISPPLLYECGLNAALDWLCRNMSERYGLKMRLAGDASEPVLPEPYQIFFFQVARELLINVAKHARASEATLTLSRVGQEVVFTVEDDGIGLPREGEEESSNRGFGLFSIRERLRLLAGKMRVESVPGIGLNVRIRLPLPVEAVQERKIA